MGKRKTKAEKQREKAEAIDTIKTYFQNAKESNQAWANRWVQKARRLQMKYKIRLPRELKRKYCKHCYSFFRPGQNLRVRTREKSVVYSCLTCKKYMRFPKN